MKDFEYRLREAVETLAFTEFPTQVVVETTAFCNLRCPACPSSLLARKRGVISSGLFRRIVDEIAEENVNTELYPAYMGEPLLYKDLFECIAYAKSRGLQKIFLNTNAMLMNDEAQYKILGSGVDRLIVSIDGFRESTYEKRRVGGDYETVKANTLGLLQKVRRERHNLTVWVQMIVDEENANEEELFKEFWLSQGAVVKIRPKLTWGGKVKSDSLSKATVEHVACPWLMRQIVVIWDGSIAMCDADHEANCNLGNANTQSIKDIWNTSFKQLRERHLNGDFNHPLCRKCHDWKVGKSEVFYPVKE